VYRQTAQESGLSVASKSLLGASHSTHMTDRPQASSGREFVYQTSDQATGAPQQHAQQSYAHYDGEHETNAPGVPENQLPAHLHDPALRYQAYGVHQQQPVPGQFGGYGFNPSMPLGWDWTNSLDFSEFTTHYEPSPRTTSASPSQSRLQTRISIDPDMLLQSQRQTYCSRVTLCRLPPSHLRDLSSRQA
jgi:hypothetical protein